MGIFCILNLAVLFRRPLTALSRLFFLVCLLLFLYTVGCGINYYRTPFSYEAGMVMEKSSTEELYSLCRFLTEQVNLTLEETDHSQDCLLYTSFPILCFIVLQRPAVQDNAA